MWAHYADSHTGIALGFDVPDHLMFDIEYIKNRIKVPVDVDQSPKRMEDLVNKMTRSKHVEWNYEEEVRLVRPLENCISEDGKYFAPLNETTVLKEVILGARYDSSNMIQLEFDLSTKEDVKILTARAEFRGFRMTKQKLSKLQKKL